MTETNRATRALAVAITLAALAVAGATGCSSSKKATDVSASDTSSTTSGSEDSTTSTTTKPGSGGGSGLTNVNCAEAYAAYAALVVEPLGLAGGASQEDIDKLQRDTDDLKAKIPAAVKDDFEVVADAYQTYGEAMSGLNPSDLMNPDTRAKVQAASESLNRSEVTAAQGRINEYFSGSCGKSE